MDRVVGPARQTVRTLAAVLSALALGLGACGPNGAPAASTIPVDTLTSEEVGNMTTPGDVATPGALALTSAAFKDGAPIPREHSCRGEDVSPPLAWTGVPAGAAALVLFVDDPDGRNWVHWTVLDLPGTDGELPRGVAPAASSPQQGRNDFGRTGYGGPCPPSGTHHYRFTLYALAAPLGLPGNPGGAAVRNALTRVTVLAQTTLVGTFRA